METCDIIFAVTVSIIGIGFFAFSTIDYFSYINRINKEAAERDPKLKKEKVLNKFEKLLDRIASPDKVFHMMSTVRCGKVLDLFDLIETTSTADNTIRVELVLISNRILHKNYEEVDSRIINLNNYIEKTKY